MGNSRGLSLGINPNPFLQETTLVLHLSMAEKVSIQLLDQSGRLVQDLLKLRKMDAGIHRFYFNKGQLQAGLFYVAVQTRDNRIVRKMIIFEDR